MVLLITGTTGIAAAAAAEARARGIAVFAAGLPEYDFTETEQAERAVAECVARHRRIDGLFNVAGASGRSRGDGPLHEISDEGWAFTIDANLGTMYRVTRAVLARMRIQEPDTQGLRGSIVNMTSVLAFDPEPERFATHAYAAAKGAAIALTKSLASYYAGDGIRVNGIAPGLTRTPMSDRAQRDPGMASWIARKQPLSHGFLEASEVAQAALYLLAPESRAITGQILVVDGGWTIA
jgi:NAD(P)-dependent dehydrogenase (short-subunit alcohol dehydrogenase family)